MKLQSSGYGPKHFPAKTLSS
uniref:Uncharacterized protein n=1 Tax=Anguilla anguilla TaxID=7936 RepID=A0A0E9SQW6_ANGAN